MRNFYKRVLLMVLLCMASEGIASGTLNAILSDSKLHWTGRKPTGSHSGTLDVHMATASFNGHFLESISVVIDMKSLNVTDQMVASWKKKLKDHLKSADFFDVQNFPQAEFKSTKISVGSKDQYKCLGILKIKGVSNEIVVPIKVTWISERIQLSTSFSIDRTKWNLKYMSRESLGVQRALDSFVYNDIEVSSEIFFEKKLARP